MDNYVTLDLHTNNSTVLPVKNISIMTLEFFQCFITYLPESHIDCSLVNPDFCLKCEIRGSYITGESMHEKSVGYMVSLIIVIISIIIGILGVFTNALTICVLRRTKVKNNQIRAFDFLLISLAYVDLFGCFCSIVACTPLVVYLEVQVSGKILLYWIYISMLLLQLCRSYSFRLTLLVAFERYMVIAYPIKSRWWFSTTKSKLHVFAILFYVLLLLAPRYTSLYIGENIYSDEEGSLDVPSLSKFDYIFRPTILHSFWSGALGTSFDYCVNFFDFWVPNLCMLIFNIWSVKKVRDISKERLKLNTNQQKELQIARMFMPVVVMVLFCNVWILVTFISTYATKTFYREIWVGLMLVYQINSSANFFIYYIRGNDFRLETNSMFRSVKKLNSTCSKIIV